MTEPIAWTHRRPGVVTWMWFSLAMIGAGVLHQLGMIPLVGWAPRPFDDDRVPAMIALIIAAHGAYLAAPPAWRVRALLGGSLVAWAVVSPAMLIIGVPWVLGFRALAWSGRRPAWSMAYIVGTLLALLVLADAAHAPRRVATHPWLWIVAYSFALGWFLRALVVWHEARIGGPRPSVRDLLTYFFFAPFALVPPYMLALPKLALVTAGVDARDLTVVRSGLRWLGYGVAVQLTLWAAARLGVDPQGLFIDALRAGDWPRAIPLALVVYPVRAVFEACGAGALVLGMVRSFGVPMAPAFDRPLLARDVADWWRRYNTHFRALLIDLFWTPVAMRLRRHPIAAGYLGCAVVFVLGSAPLHWPKQAALHASPWTFPWSTLAESAIMTALVGTALAIERRRGRRREVPGPVRAWTQRAGTWALVCGAILAVGYQLDYRVRIAPWERAAAAAHAVESPAEAVALVPALESAVDERPTDPVRRATLARVLVTAGRPDAAWRQLALATAFATHQSLADARLLARRAPSRPHLFPRSTP